ncbi:Ig-like domain-containing protein [Desulfuromonas sp. TF]|uniref:Ig-like domain-containing protein n=1 Tax=Desulfuromonas sp. TF TaxID=1232410 RepID=UPI000403F391|nr:Ig-like domain-containing protein [Desulfuromonas sp. TF]
MKMAVWFSGYKKFLLVLMGLALLGACGSETDEDLTTPALTMDAIDPSTFDKEKTLSGTIEAGAGLDVFVSSSAKVGEINIEDGTWSCTISDLAVGNNLVTVSADDSQGNTSSLQFLLLYEVIKIDQADTTTAQPTSTVHGRLAPGASITSVTLNGDPVPSPVPENDAFSLFLVGLVPGNNAVKITAQDTETDTQTISFTIVSDENAVSLAIDKPVIPIEEHSLVLTGTVGEGGEVAVSVEPQATVGTVAYPTTTSWQVTIDDLEERDNIITVTAAQAEKTTASAWTRVVVADPTPTVLTTEPANLAENVLPDTVLKATFSEAVVASSVNAATFLLANAGGAVAGEVAYSAADTSATFTPAAPLAPGPYTATISGIKDPNGNLINHPWNFTVVVQ